jgi:HAMP domain-containing protein/DNA-directed RNA polymerase subunit RPC12/RpoP
MQIIQCDKCGKRYKVNGNNNKPTAKYKCKACGHLIVVVSQASANENRQTHAPKATPSPHKTIQLNPGRKKETFTAHNEDTLNVAAAKEQMEKALGLRTKFNLAIGVVFLCAVVLIYFLSGSRLQKDAETQVADKARLLLTTMESSRSFTSKVIKPALYKALPGRFIAEGMSSSFGARNIFERIRKSYPQYYFKHAAPHPRNLMNQADDFEMSIIQKFSIDPGLKEWQGYRTKGDAKEYTIMKPIVAKERCMRCHSDPAKAPQELLDRYGNKNGFGRSVGEVIGTLTVSVPASVVMEKARENTMIFIGMVVIFFVLLTLIVNLFFSRMVVKPIKNLADNANEISLGKLDTQINTSGGDEIAMLAKAFKRMNISIKMAFDQLAR